jgi:flagellar biosynthesis/type III secretory pathway chaperone
MQIPIQELIRQRETLAAQLRQANAILAEDLEDYSSLRKRCDESQGNELLAALLSRLETVVRRQIDANNQTLSAVEADLAQLNRALGQMILHAAPITGKGN